MREIKCVQAQKILLFGLLPSEYLCVNYDFSWHRGTWQVQGREACKEHTQEKKNECKQMFEIWLNQCFFKGKCDQENQEAGEDACGTRECNCPILDGKMTEFGGVRSFTPEQMPGSKNTHPFCWTALGRLWGKPRAGQPGVLGALEQSSRGRSWAALGLQPLALLAPRVQWQRGSCSPPKKGNKSLSDIKTASVSKLEGKE